MSLHRPLPLTIVFALITLLLLAMCLVGFQSGLTSNRRTVASAILVVAFAVVMTLITELDSLQSSVLRVKQQAMIEVQNDIRLRSAN
jgi:hypothetical protein